MVGHAPCSYVYVLMCVGDAPSSYSYMCAFYVCSYSSSCIYLQIGNLTHIQLSKAPQHPILVSFSSRRCSS